MSIIEPIARSAHLYMIKIDWIGIGLELDWDWIGLDWIGLDWIENQLTKTAQLFVCCL